MGEAEVLRYYELRLLRCTLPPDETTVLPPSPDHYRGAHSQPSTWIDATIRCIEAGQYVAALSSESVRAVFKSADSIESHFNEPECADRLYSDLLRDAIYFLLDDSKGDTDQCHRAVFLMATAIAAFLAFTQSNLTGPKEELPLFHTLFKGEKASVDCGRQWEVWASKQLMSAGSDLYGKFSNLEYIVFAKMLLLRIKDVLFERSISSVNEIRSISWWLARILLLQQRMLDDKSSSLFESLQVLFAESLNHFGSPENVISYWGANSCQEEASNILSMLHVEAGMMEYSYGRVDPCRLHFKSAEIAAGLQLSVIGALGFRTVHQTEPKAQLVLVSENSTSNGGNACPTLLEGFPQRENREVSDVLVTPRLIENGDKFGMSAKSCPNSDAVLGPLKPTQQIVILSECLLIEKSTRHDEMQRWEMAPYIEAIDSQKSLYFIIKRFNNILRVRWESGRSRTKERALLMMEELDHVAHDPCPGVPERIYFCFGVQLPPIPAIRKEYGELLVSCGLIREAVKIFEDLELWDNLIYCYRLLDKKAAAIEIIKKRLSEMPNDPRLWCSLGDFTNNDAYYEKALDVSDDRSARAMRSLARSAYNRGDFAKSMHLWESAMSLNSMYSDGWFALGAASLKARNVEKALDGFTRAVQLDPENGEAWNNIACLHKIKQKSKEAFIAFKEALKFKRDSWQLWENYSHVAVDIGHFGQALHAIQMVLDLTGNKRIDAELLDKLMARVERTANLKSVDSYSSCTNELSSPEPKASMQENKHFVEFFGKILQRIVRNDGGAEIWGLYARWNKYEGDLTMCSEALVKQVRSYQGSDLWKDEIRFRKFADASLELCGVYMEMASSSGSRRELVAAEMLLKSIIRQAGSFTETQEFKNLLSCLDEVKIKLQPTS